MAIHSTQSRFAPSLWGIGAPLLLRSFCYKQFHSIESSSKSLGRTDTFMFGQDSKPLENHFKLTDCKS